MSLKPGHPCDRLGRIEPVDLSPEVRLASLAVLERLEAAGFPVGPCVAASAAAAAIDALHRSGAGPAFAASLLARAESRRRRRLIPQQFDGRNHAELARRYGVSIKTVRRNRRRRAALEQDLNREDSAITTWTCPQTGRSDRGRCKTKNRTRRKRKK